MTRFIAFEEQKFAVFHDFAFLGSEDFGFEACDFGQERGGFVLQRGFQ